NEGNARAGRLQFTFLQLPRMWLELLAVSGLAILVLLMVWQGRPPALVLPALGLFAAAAFRVLPSVNRILTSVQSMRFGAPAVDLLFAETRLANAAPVGASTTRRRFTNVLEMHDVTFAYPGTTQPALRSVSLSVRRGETVGFIGASGSGPRCRWTSHRAEGVHVTQLLCATRRRRPQGSRGERGFLAARQYRHRGGCTREARAALAVREPARDRGGAVDADT